MNYLIPRYKLAFDIDETLVPCLSVFLEYYNNEHGTDFSQEDFNTYKWWKILGISKKRAYSLAQTYFTSEGNFYENCPDSIHFLKFLPEAEPALDILSRFYELYAISHRIDELYPHTFQMSSALYVSEDSIYFPQVKVVSDDLILPDERIFHINGSKSEICRSLGIKTMVEDDAEVGLELAENGIETILIEKTWNKNYKKLHPNIIRKNSLQSACDYLLMKVGSRPYGLNFI